METGNKTTSSAFLDVLDASKANIQSSTYVGRICKVESVNNDSITCININNEQQRLKCIAFQNLVIQKGDIVLVMFTDEDYRQNIKRIKNNERQQNYETTILHSLNYGVIIGIIYRKEEN